MQRCAFSRPHPLSPSLSLLLLCCVYLVYIHVRALLTYFRVLLTDVRLLSLLPILILRLLCMYVCVYIHTYIHTYSASRALATHIHSRICECVCAHTHIRLQNNTTGGSASGACKVSALVEEGDVNDRVRELEEVCVCVRVGSLRHKHMHSRTYAHTHRSWRPSAQSTSRKRPATKLPRCF